MSSRMGATTTRPRFMIAAGPTLRHLFIPGVENDKALCGQIVSDLSVEGPWSPDTESLGLCAHCVTRLNRMISHQLRRSS